VKTRESFDQRFELVHSRFRRARLVSAGRGLWEHSKWVDGSPIASSSALFMILILEPSLWMDSWPPAPFNIAVPKGVAFSLLIFPLFSGWLIDRYLSLKTPNEATFPRWLLGIRFFASTLPIGELYILPAWKAFLHWDLLTRMGARRPATRLCLTKVRCTLPSALRARRLYDSGIFLAVLISWFPLLIFWACWITTTPALARCRHTVVILICTTLHIAFFLATTHVTHHALRESGATARQRYLAFLLLFCGLLPLPFPVTNILVSNAWGSSLKTLIARSYSRRPETVRLPLWVKLQEALHEHWQARPWLEQWRRPLFLDKAAGTTQVDAEVKSLYRLKTLLLPFDGAFFFAALSRLTTRVPSIAGEARAALQWLASCGIIFMVVGLIFQGARWCAQIFRISHLADKLTRHPYGRYLILTPLALMAGMVGALLIERGQIELFGGLLVVCSTFWALGSGLCLVLQKPNQVRATGLWGSLSLAFVVLGGLIYVGIWNLQSIIFITRLLAILTPLLALILWGALGGWLLRPFSWWSVLDRNLPLRLRAVLAILVVTATLPLGGLAIPFWIYARHRVWPRYEPLLEKVTT
jgi:hypothetical protein